MFSFSIWTFISFFYLNFLSIIFLFFLFFLLKSRNFNFRELDWSNLPQNSNSGREFVQKFDPPPLEPFIHHYGYLFEIHKNFIFPNPKKNEPMKISAPYFLYNQEFWNIQFPWKNIG